MKDQNLPDQMKVVHNVLMAILNHASNPQYYRDVLESGNWKITKDVSIDMIRHIKTTYSVQNSMKSFDEKLFRTKFNDEFELMISKIDEEKKHQDTILTTRTYTHVDLPKVYICLHFVQHKHLGPQNDIYTAFVFGDETICRLPVQIVFSQEYSGLFSLASGQSVTSNIENFCNADIEFPHTTNYGNLDGFSAEAYCLYGGRSGGNRSFQTSVFGLSTVERFKGFGFTLPKTILYASSRYWDR